MAPRGVRTRGGVDQDQQALGGRINSEHDLEGHPTGSVFAGKTGAQAHGSFIN